MPTTCLYSSDCCKVFPIFTSRINSNSTKTSDLLKEDSCSFAQDILSFAQGNSQSSQRSLRDDWLVWVPARVYCLLVRKQTMFFNVKNLPLAPQYPKRLLKISANFVRNIHNHAKVEKPSATCNNKRCLTWFEGKLHVLWFLKYGMGGFDCW